ncbi:MAG TPA: hypothetical protein VJR23_05290 [Candidatus Acidoferrales bacterium]|nr:hypothetical protein [Candidatus Acidoferrales bacterium]
MRDEIKNSIPSTLEIAQRGEAIYKEKWEKRLAQDSAGKFVAINIDNSDALVADTSEEAVRLAQEKYPDGYFHLIRVGHAGAFDAGWYTSHAR